MPYISASIMMQLLTAVIPQLGRLAREDGGRQKIMQYTRYATVALCIFQGYLLAVSFQHPESYHTMLPGITETIARLGIPLVDDPGWSFRIDHGAFAHDRDAVFDVAGRSNHRARNRQRYFADHHGRHCRAPARRAWRRLGRLLCLRPRRAASQVNPAILVLMVAFLFIVIAAVIAVTQGVRKITVQYAKRVVGRKMYGGQTQYMPLKVNYAGVMPIIFAWALLLFPTTIVSVAFKNSPTAQQIADDALQWLAALRRSGGDDFLLQLFLGGDAISTLADRGRSEEIRRLHSRACVRANRPRISLISR